MGKRGPKPGCGGRPITYNDAYHVVHRERCREYRARMKVESERLNDLGVVRLFNAKK